MKRLAAILLFISCFCSGYAQNYGTADAYFIRATHFRISNNNEKAAEYFEKALTEEKNQSPQRTEQIYKLLNFLVQTYTDLNYAEKITGFSTEQIELCDKTKGRASDECLSNRIGLGAFYNSSGEHQNAVTCYTELLDIVRTDLGENTLEFARVATLLGDQYNKIKNYEMAAELLEHAASIVEAVAGKDFFIYDFIRNDIANSYMAMRRFEEALQLFLDIYDHPNLKGEDWNALKKIILFNLAVLHKNLGKSPDAIVYYQLLLDELNNADKKDWRFISVVQNDISLVYQYLGEYDKALPLADESLRIAGEYLGEDDAEYGTRLNNLGVIYQSLGMNEKALELYRQSLENTEKTFGKNHLQYAIRLNNLALIYQSLNQPETALPLFLEAQSIIEKTEGVQGPQYANNLGNLALCYQQLKEYDKALPIYLQALERTKTSMGENSADYVYRLNNIGWLYQQQKEYLQAYPYYKSAHEKVIKVLGEEHPMFYYITINTATLNENLGRYDQSFNLYAEAFENTKKQIRRNFSFLSEQQKEKFLVMTNSGFDFYKSFFWDYTGTVKEIPGMAYDIELLSKGLILSSSEQLRQSVEASDDPEILRLYDEWFAKKSAIAQQYALNESERTPELSKWEEDAENMERQLLTRSDAFQQTAQIGKTGLKEVQAELKENQAAIEFVSFQHRDIHNLNDTVYYYALVLRKNDEQPKLVKLTTRNEIETLFTSAGSGETQVANLYRGSIVVSTGQQDLTKIYDLIWKPLEEFLNEGETIYFAPSGALNQIAFSAITTPDGKYLSDKYDLRQVSTTAKILESENKSEFSEIALFGGINYDESTDVLALASKNIKGKEDFVSRSLTEDLNRGGESWNYLQGTLNEVQDIKAIAEKNKVKVDYYTGNNALEEQFKALNGKNSPQILHIATHGFFFPDPEISKEELDRIKMTGEQQNMFKLSDNPLNRSGLLFAGANHTWKGEKTPEGIEDGILTAYEASNVSLPNTELVVLSACETGLGDIKGSEGVYGLQRSFKIAGAKYLLMSLWQVPDKETAEFMEYFYQKLFANNNIEQSYKETQDYMKAKYPDEPYKWAAFVLVR